MPSYNNYYPATYQSPVGYPQYAQATPQITVPQMSMATQPQNSNGLIWVQGEVGAKAYPVAPNNSVMLLDSEENRFYIKSTDSSGMPMPLRVFSYTEEVATQHSHDETPTFDTNKFITREEFEEFEERMTNLRQKNEFKKEKNNG